MKSSIYEMDHFTSKPGGAMVHIEFTNEEIEQLKYERYNHPHPRVQKKMEALLLKSYNLPHNTITKITGISSATLWRYLLDFKEGGIEKLKEINFYKPESDLMAHKDSIENYFRSNPPKSIPEAMKCIEDLTGIKRSPTQVGQFLKRIGMKRLKAGMIPAKADPEVQDEFLKKI